MGTLIPVTIGAFTHTYAECGFDYTLTLDPVAPSPSLINLNADGTTVDIYGTDPSEIATYNVVVTATFDDPVASTNSDVTF